MLSSSRRAVKASSRTANADRYASDPTLSATLPDRGPQTWTLDTFITDPPPIECALPIRSLPAYPGKRARESHWWFQPTMSFKRCESGLEAQAVLWLEFSGAREISTQPFRLAWSGGHSHVPDLFAVLADGTRLVVDVRPLEHADEEVFAATGEVCARLGWTYVVFAGLDTAVVDLLESLARYRHQRLRPPDTQRLIDDLATPPYGQVINRHAQQFGVAKDTVIGWVAHLMWHRYLPVDLAISFQDHVR